VLQEVKKRFPDGVPLLHPVKDMNIKDEEFLTLIKKLEMYEKRMNEHSLHTDKERDTLYAQYTNKIRVIIYV
jgi:ATP-dependent RNA helicase DOB1